MDPRSAQSDNVFWQKILAARQQSPEEKLLAGGRLFDELCERMKSELRTAHPEFDEDTIDRLLSERLKADRDAEEEGIYIPVDSSEFLIPRHKGP